MVVVERNLADGQEARQQDPLSVAACGESGTDSDAFSDYTFVEVSDSQDSADEGLSVCSEDHDSLADDDVNGELASIVQHVQEHGPSCFVRLQREARADPLAILANFGVVLAGDSHAANDYHCWAFLERFLLRHVYCRQALAGLGSFDDALCLIDNARRIVIVAGAGISVSCGIPDFRSPGAGLYAQIRKQFAQDCLDRPEDLFDIDQFRRDPRPFFALARQLLPQKCTPSLTHFFLRDLEIRGKLCRLFTQNIDTIEEEVGLERVVYCHGSFRTATCQGCAHQTSLEGFKELLLQEQAAPLCPYCSVGIVKPDIVFFGESLPPVFDQCVARDLPEADLLIVVGSSLKVHPVAGIPDLLHPSVPQILINREPIADHNFDVVLLGEADEIFARIAKRLGWQACFGRHQSLWESDQPYSQCPESNVSLFKGALCRLDDHPVGESPVVLDN